MAIGQYKGVDITQGDQANIQAQMAKIDAQNAPTTVPPVRTQKGIKSPYNPSTPIPAANLGSNTGTYNPPSSSRFSQTSVGVGATAQNEPIATPPPVSESQTKRQSLYDTFTGAGADVATKKEEARKAADIQLKNEEYNKQLAAYKNRKNEYDDQIEKIEKNPEGKLTGSLQQEVDDLRRKANKDLAYMAVGVELAQNNYLGAEKILEDRIKDITQEYEVATNTFQAGMSFLQNDLTDSEKLQASQAFEREQTQTKFDLNELASQRDFVRQKGLLSYKSGLDNTSSSPTFTPTQVNNGAANAGVSFEVFNTYDPDSQNFFINNPATELQKKIKTTITDQLTSGKTADSIKTQIDESTLFPSVKDYMKAKVDEQATTVKPKGWFSKVIDYFK